MKLILSDKDFNKEPIVRLWLAQSEDEDDNSIDLMAQKEGGTPYYILTFRNDGTISRVSCVPEDIGFGVDNVGRVVIE